LSFAGPRLRAADADADADPETGYLIHGASVGGLNRYGSTAVTVSYLDHRVGFWNPAIDNAVASSFKRNKSHRPRTDVRPGAVASGQARQ
jgi:hypothetical protein